MSEQARKMTGCRLLHYAPVTITGGMVSFGTPTRIPNIEEYNYTFLFVEASNYADNQQNIYMKKITGADLGLVLSDLAGKVEAELMGKEHSKGGTLTNTNNIQKAVALLWEETYSDGTAVRNVFYNTKLSKDEVSGKTEGESMELTAVNLSGKAIPLPNGDIHYKLDTADEEVDQEKFDAWFEAVQTLKGTVVRHSTLDEVRAEAKTLNANK